jgi:glucoamylase
MPKHIMLGNGRLLIGLDRFAQVKDFYYHYAGLENHVGEFLSHKIGFMADGRFSWFDSGSWEIEVLMEKDTMASSVSARHQDLGLKLSINDIVYNEKNIFIRSFKLENLFDIKRDIKVFFNQQFQISQNHIGDTAYYLPDDRVVVHYKGRRVFLANAKVGNKGVSDYSVGLLGIEGKDGTFKDAEDGELSQNPIEHGRVDSVIALDFSIDPKKTKDFQYWITVGKSIKKVYELNDLVLARDPKDIIKSTKDYWSAWVTNQNFSFYGLGPHIIELFNKSLLVIRSHVSDNGSIIASGDSEMLQHGRDYYEYVWPRDAAISATALAKAGDFNASRRFFEFCNDIITNDGYFMHKYRPDKSLGSSWHPWVRNGEKQLPIQEDETALVIQALGIHFELSKDLEFIESIYNSLIKKAAEFMADFRDDKTGLPQPSYDLWEEKYGVHTYTAASVYAALQVAAKFAKLLGKEKAGRRYEAAAGQIKEAIMKHLFDDKENVFHKSVYIRKGEVVVDKTLDFSSIYAIYKFGVLDSKDELLTKSMQIFRERLEVKTDIGGIARFEGDIYHTSGGNIPGNPWIITTNWLTQYLTEFIEKEAQLPDLVRRFTWVTQRALPSGMLPEQINPYSGEPLSATPLIWSHAEYVISIIKYLEKLEELGICKACYPVA